jgi:predicted nucleic acid-binding protein
LIVVDASVIAAALGDDGVDGQRSRARLSGERLVAPELIDLEVASVWRRLCAANQLHPDRADRALADLEALRLHRVSHRALLQRCWELRSNMTVYDAAYIAVAERLGATLLTADLHLARAPGTECHVELMTSRSL